jgi:hypothetical protein
VASAVKSQLKKPQNHRFMKIRCQANSLRFRLRKSDVETLRVQGKVSEAIALGLAFELYAAALPAPTAALDGGLLRIGLPEEQLRAWMSSDAVGIEAELALSQGPGLHLLIEKDFPCQHRPHEDKQDTFEELAGKSEG